MRLAQLLPNLMAILQALKQAGAIEGQPIVI